MTLHVYNDIEQRSPEWYDLRRGIVTASTVGQLITAKTLKPAANDYSRALTAQLVAERITGHVEETFVNYDMQRGVDSEPLAVAAYEQHTGTKVEPCGFMVREIVRGGSVDPIGLSPDGLVGEDGLIEIKSPRAKTHIQTVLSGKVPAAYMPQIQAALLVSGRDWCDFVSYCGGLHLYTIRVEPDMEWFEAISEALRIFEETAAEMVAAYEKATEGLPMTERVDYTGLELKL